LPAGITRRGAPGSIDTEDHTMNARRFQGRVAIVTGVVLPVDGGKTPQMYIPDFDLTALDNRSIT
jgi:hypothetical protein